MAETKSAPGGEGATAGKTPSGPRCAAIVGPYQTGKTSLMESLLHACGAIHRKGSVKEGNTVGDVSAEARSRQMSVELTAASAEYLGEKWHFIDCPGSIEFPYDAYAGMSVADVVVVVCEPEIERAVLLSPFFQFLDEREIPHMLFINKMDNARVKVRDLLSAIQNYSERKLVLRHVPIREGEEVKGYVDLTSERAYAYRSDQESERTEIPASVREREEEARQELLETLADFDDDLLEQILEDVDVSTAEIYQRLTKDLQEDRIVPVFLGAAEREHGVRRLLKALRHETPEVSQTYERMTALADLPQVEPAAQIFKSYHLPHVGKVSLARVWCGALSEGDKLGDVSLGAMSRVMGHNLEKASSAVAGDVIGFNRQDNLTTGDLVTPRGASPGPNWPAATAPVYSLAIASTRREDEVKLSTGLSKLVDEDPSLSYGHDPDTHELVVSGQGEAHIKLAMERLENRYHVSVDAQQPRVPYRETIRKSVQKHARHKKQTGGHGEFGDVHVEVKPLARGGGFEFIDQITGGAIPKQYIPAVEAGVKEYMTEGPLGFPVVDVSVRLFDGKHHPVDSSEMAFKRAGILAMKEALPDCDPVLLEPVVRVTVSVPSEYTSNAQQAITKRRGQLFGFDARPGWPGWDELTAQMPQSELHALIFELRSLSLGVASYTWSFDHLAEITGRLSDDIISAHRAAAE